jgi:hypothetical protein
MAKKNEGWDVLFGPLVTQQQTINVCGVGGQERCQNDVQLSWLKIFLAGDGLNQKRRGNNGKRERMSLEVPCPVQMKYYCKTFHQRDRTTWGGSVKHTIASVNPIFDLPCFIVSTDMLLCIL